MARCLTYGDTMIKGSIIEPTLFLIYTNDIIMHMKFFTDDTKIYGYRN